MKKCKKFTADFETLVDEEETRVWAYSICEIGNIDNFIYGNNIDDFIKWCSNPDENYVLYFHNLKFDASFILNYLFRNGYRWIKSSKEKDDKTFTTLISSMGVFYSVEIYFEVGKKINKVTIFDSLKLLPFSVKKIAEDFHLPINKLEIDYKKHRSKNHKLTKKEIDYIRNDVTIVAMALDSMFKNNLTKMTIGSNALASYRKMIKQFARYYPYIPNAIDADIRKSYKGGFTYLNPIYKDKVVTNETVLDVNSLYPYVLHSKLLPFGKPIFFEGKYKKSILYPLYIQMLTCSFELKENKIPTIQIKNSLKFLPNEYLTSSKGQLITLTLTNVDLDLFLDMYEVKDITYHAGWKFKAQYGLFTRYVENWTNEKINSKKNKNYSMYIISKLMLNSLYGKFAKNPNVRVKIPYLEDEILHYHLSDLEESKGLYIPIGSFVTSYARDVTIRASLKIKDYSLKKYGEDRYIYSDTDSIHVCNLTDEELMQIVNIDDYKLGYFKIEEKARRGKYIRQKCYIQDVIITEEEYNKGILTEFKDSYFKDDNGFYVLRCTIAGLPKELGRKYVNFDNFKEGFTLLADEHTENKLRYKQVKGGVVLVDTDFTIKE